MKFSSGLDRMVRTWIKIRREWWHEHEFIFYADVAGFTPPVGSMEYYITRVGDRYDDIYPINTTLLNFPALLVHGRTGWTGSWAPGANDCLAKDWKVCKNWKELNEKARERHGSSYPHSETMISTLTLADYDKTHSGVYAYDVNNK